MHPRTCSTPGTRRQLKHSQYFLRHADFLQCAFCAASSLPPRSCSRTPAGCAAQSGAASTPPAPRRRARCSSSGSCSRRKTPRRRSTRSTASGTCLLAVALLRAARRGGSRRRRPPRHTARRRPASPSSAAAALALRQRRRRGLHGEAPEPICLTAANPDAPAGRASSGRGRGRRPPRALQLLLQGAAAAVFFERFRASRRSSCGPRRPPGGAGARESSPPSLILERPANSRGARRARRCCLAGERGSHAHRAHARGRIRARGRAARPAARRRALRDVPRRAQPRVREPTVQTEVGVELQELSPAIERAPPPALAGRPLKSLELRMCGVRKAFMCGLEGVHRRTRGGHMRARIVPRTRANRSTKAFCVRVFLRDRAIGAPARRAARRAVRARLTRDARFPIPRVAARRATHRAGDPPGTRRARGSRRAMRTWYRKICARAYLLQERRDAGDVGDVVEDAGAKGRLRERSHGVKHVPAGAQRHPFQRALPPLPCAPLRSPPDSPASAALARGGRAEIV